MGLEAATDISQLVVTNPVGATDTGASLDDHIRLIKSTLKATFPNVTGAITPTHTVLNYMLGVTSAVQDQIDAKAPIASPTLTGTPSAPTPAAGTNTTQIATTAFVASAGLTSALPGQVGNSGKTIATDGTTATWSDSLKATVMRWADGTDATKKLAFTLSGFTTATTRTATWPNKDGTVAMISDTAMVLLATLTPTAAANVDALTTFSSTYDNYRILVDGIKPAVDDVLMMRLAVGGTTDAGANYQGATYIGPAPSGTAAAGIGLSFSATVLNANDATNGKVVALAGSSHRSGTTYDAISAPIMYSAANAVSGVRFLWFSGANFAATGKIRIYGYRNT